MEQFTTPQPSLYIPVRTRLSPGVLALPAIFYFTSSVLSLYWLYRLLDIFDVLLRQPPGTAGVEELLGEFYYLSWAFIVYAGFVASAMVSSYVLLKNLREHLYYSALAVQSARGVQDQRSLVTYVETFITRSNLPSPVTGLLLPLFTLGLSYPVVLALAENAVRSHASLEEELVRGSGYTRTRGTGWLALDISLFFLTFGLYTVYASWRLARVFNKHLDTVHGEPAVQPPSAETLVVKLGGLENPPVALVVGIYLVVLGSIVLILYAGLPGSVMVFGTGILLSCIPLVRREGDFGTTVLLALALIYLTIVSGILCGIAAFDRYSAVLDYLRELRELFGDGVLDITLHVFLNNFALSIPAAIPVVGAVFLAQGAFNTGFILGVGVASGYLPVEALLVLLYPHAILEILAYALILSSSMYYTKTRKFARVLISGVLLLLFAAFVEALTIEFLASQ